MNFVLDKLVFLISLVIVSIIYLLEKMTNNQGMPVSEFLTTGGNKDYQRKNSSRNFNIYNKNSSTNSRHTKFGTGYYDYKPNLNKNRPTITPAGGKITIKHEKPITASEVDKQLITVMEKLAEKYSGKKIEEIPYSIDFLEEISPYIPIRSAPNVGIHNGQVKLFLSEVQILTKTTKNVSEPELVIYIGSAPGEHDPILLEMFPNKKFLFIDPNFHNIDSEFLYVYQNRSVILSSNHKKFQSDFQLASQGKIAKHRIGVKRLANMRFYNQNTSYNVLDFNKNKSEMEKIQNEFYEKNYENLIEDILASKDRIYVIQDYATLNLSDYLAKSIQKAKCDNFTLISDIRTNLFADQPTDLDYVWNDALQLGILLKLKPTFSLLKFHPPYHTNDISFPDIYPSLDADNIIKQDLDWIKTNYSIDMVENYKNNVHMYPKAVVYTQCWAPISSTESRLLIKKDDLLDIAGYVNYDNTSWDMKFMHFKLLRGVAYFDLYESLSKEVQKSTGYEYGNFDINYELLIVADYILNYLTVQGKPDQNDFDYDFTLIKQKLRESEFQKQVEKIKNIISRFSFSYKQKMKDQLFVLIAPLNKESFMQFRQPPV